MFISLAAVGLILMVVRGLVGHDAYPGFYVVVGSVGLLVLACFTGVFIRFLRYGFSPDTPPGRMSQAAKWLVGGLVIFAVTVVVAVVAFHVPLPESHE